MFGWSERGTGKLLVIFGGWLFVVGIADSFVQGPGALICSFFGLFPLLGGLRVLGRQRNENRKKVSAPDEE